MRDSKRSICILFIGALPPSQRTAIYWSLKWSALVNISWRTLLLRQMRTMLEKNSLKLQSFIQNDWSKSVSRYCSFNRKYTLSKKIILFPVPIGDVTDLILPRWEQLITPGQGDTVKVIVFPVPSRDVTNHSLPGRE